MKTEAKDILIKHLRLKGCTTEHIRVGILISCIGAMEEYARMKNKELQFALNVLTPTSKKKLKCDCEEPLPNYPEMVWCDKCGFEIDNVNYCNCSPDPTCRIKSNRVYCNSCNLERI